MHNFVYFIYFHFNFNFAGSIYAIVSVKLRFVTSLDDFGEDIEMSNSKVVYEGWMQRYGRMKIGRSFIHMRYFVLESRLLACYKRKPQDNVVTISYYVFFSFVLDSSNIE
ncbi:putative pleckstrin domain-containing protein [Helianthus anomalus]